jgi:hypothetical protein
MDKTQRAQLLRERFRAKGGVPFVAPAIVKPRRQTKGQGFRLIAFGKSNDGRQPVWLQRPDAAPKIIPKSEHRRKGKNALARIAAHYPVGLPKR